MWGLLGVKTSASTPFCVFQSLSLDRFPLFIHEPRIVPATILPSSLVLGVIVLVEHRCRCCLHRSNDHHHQNHRDHHHSSVSCWVSTATPSSSSNAKHQQPHHQHPLFNLLMKSSEEKASVDDPKALDIFVPSALPWEDLHELYTFKCNAAIKYVVAEPTHLDSSDCLRSINLLSSILASAGSWHGPCSEEDQRILGILHAEGMVHRQGEAWEVPPSARNGILPCRLSEGNVFKVLHPRQPDDWKKAPLYVCLYWLSRRRWQLQTIHGHVGRRCVAYDPSTQEVGGTKWFYKRRSISQLYLACLLKAEDAGGPAVAHLQKDAW